MTGLTFSEGRQYLVLMVIGVSTCDLVHDVETFSASVSCDDSGVWKTAICGFPGNTHKDFKEVLVVNIGKVQSPHCALGHLKLRR